MEEQLLKQIVELPSFFEPKTRSSEKKLSDFIVNFFNTNFPDYIIKKIKVDRNRNNLLILPKNPNVIFCCHLDTVLPSNKEKTKLTIRGDKAYGLGTKDMKGGIVSAIMAVLESPNVLQQKAGFLFYCDEEYSQKGIEIMLADKTQIPSSVRYLISPESRFNICYGYRGYGEISLIVNGKKAHSSRPQQGINAGEVFMRIYGVFKNKFSKIKTELGRNSATLTNLYVGILVNNLIKGQNNIVPDYAEGTISLRISNITSRKELQDMLINIIRDLYGEKLKFKIKIQQLRSPSFITSKDKIAFFIKCIKKTGFIPKLANPGLSGYNDVAMLSSKFKIPLLGFGPYGEGNHGPNEWVSIKSIINTKMVFKTFLIQMSKDNLSS